MESKIRSQKELIAELEAKIQASTEELKKVSSFCVTRIHVQSCDSEDTVCVRTCINDS